MDEPELVDYISQLKSPFEEDDKRKSETIIRL